MGKTLIKRIAELGIRDDYSINELVDLLSHLLEIEQEKREIATCVNSRLLEMKEIFLEMVEEELNPILHELENRSVSLRVVIEQLEKKVIRGLMTPLKGKKIPIKAQRIHLEDALGSLIYEIRFLILHMVVNHPECRLHDPHRVYVLLYPEVEEDIQNTGILYNLLNQLYKDLTRFLSFESLPESFVPRSMKQNPTLWTKNITIWDYIREIFQSGKLIRPETWIAIGKELQTLISAGEQALVECGGMMRLSDKTDLEEKIKVFHKYAFSLAECHIQCLSHFKNQNFDLITPYDMKQMVELTIQLDETVSELQNFLRIWMRHLEARTCMHYTVVLQTLEEEGGKD